MGATDGKGDLAPHQVTAISKIAELYGNEYASFLAAQNPATAAYQQQAGAAAVAQIAARLGITVEQVRNMNLGVNFGMSQQAPSQAGLGGGYAMTRDPRTGIAQVAMSPDPLDGVRSVEGMRKGQIYIDPHPTDATAMAMRGEGTANLAGYTEQQRADVAQYIGNYQKDTDTFVSGMQGEVGKRATDTRSAGLTERSLANISREIDLKEQEFNVAHGGAPPPDPVEQKVYYAKQRRIALAHDFYTHGLAHLAPLYADDPDGGQKLADLGQMIISNVLNGEPAPAKGDAFTEFSAKYFGDTP